VLVLFRALEGKVETSTTTVGSRPDWYLGAWLIGKAGLALIAILLFTLTVAAIEFRMGITPTDDSATDWTLSGE
jgi:hypothetical protein